MATDAEILAQIDAGILATTTGLAAGKFVTEYTIGGVRIKKESPTLLLEALREARQTYQSLVNASDRSAGVATFGGAL